MSQFKVKLRNVRMKLTITTLTGDKFDVEVKAEDKVKDIKVSNAGMGCHSDTSGKFLFELFVECFK